MATLKYIQFLERDKICKAWQDRRNLYTICTPVFPNIPEKAHKIPWSVRNMEPPFMNSYKVHEADESRDKTSNVAITFTFDDVDDPLTPEKICPSAKDPREPCRDKKIKTVHYDVYNYNLITRLNKLIPKNSIFAEIGACNKGQFDDNIYTFTASLVRPSHVDEIIAAVYEFITLAGFSNIQHVIMDTLSDNSYEWMTNLLIASHYDVNAEEKEDEEDDEWCWESIYSFIHWTPEHNISVNDNDYSHEIGVFTTAYDAIYEVVNLAIRQSHARFNQF